MGGYHFYNENGPLYPLSPKHVIELVRRRRLVPRTTEEIASQSKGDALSKGVAILQTLWFVTQCIARRIEHLPVTNLEIMTLAYTVITVAMYIVWWDKPLNISCAVRVPKEEVKKEQPNEFYSIGDCVVAYVIGDQDDYVDLEQCSRVPTFWAGDRDDSKCFDADVFALLVAMAFGAVHCIAWFEEFRSPLEQLLWRVCSIVIIAIPAALAIVFVGGLLLDTDNGDYFELVLTIFYVPLALAYIAARLTLIVISFTSLQVLPVAAYQTVRWSAFLPHL